MPQQDVRPLTPAEQQAATAFLQMIKEGLAEPIDSHIAIKVLTAIAEGKVPGFTATRPN